VVVLHSRFEKEATMQRAHTIILGVLGVMSLTTGAGADWIIRYSDASEVTDNQRFSTAVNFSDSADETPIVALVNDSDQPLKVQTIRILVSRYIGIGDASKDDWYITFRKDQSDVLGATEWDGNAKISHFGPPTSSIDFLGAADREGHPVQDTTLASLGRFNMVIPPHSVRYLGVGNLLDGAFGENGLTFIMLTDRRLDVDDYGFTSVAEPRSRTMSDVTGDQFKNAAINVEVVPFLSVGKPKKLGRIDLIQSLAPTVTAATVGIAFCTCRRRAR
jgi:hypothetical protein